MEGQHNYWREQLAGSAAPFELPLDYPRPPAPSYFRERTSHTIASERWDAIAHNAAKSGLDRFTCVLGAYAVVAFRYSQANDLVVGSATLIGKPNPTAIRVQIAETASAREFLLTVQSTLDAAAVNADLPFSALAALSAGKPLFRSMLLPAPSSSVLWDTSDGPRPGAFGAVATDCDLVISVTEEDGGARLGADYDAELFDASTIERLLGQIEEAAWQISSNLDEPVLALPIITAAERVHLLHDLNLTRVSYDRDACVHELFEAQAERTPDAVALVFGTDALTYAELNARSNQLAHLLVAKGVIPDELVGICVERSPEMVIAILAVLKAGGAYIPMDPGYPANRIAYMVDDSRVQLVLGDGDAAETAARDVEVVRIDRHPEAGQPTSNLGQRASSFTLAYVIYTSGSTGNPKGVMVEHRNVVNFFAGMDLRLGTAPGVWLAVTSLSFDISVLELLWTLTHGYKVVLFSPQLARGQATATPAKAGARAAMEFGLFYFGSDEGAHADQRGREKYRLLLDGARFADEHGFSAVWTPERHFHTFGGLFPSPAVAAGALAMATERVSLRAGSVVLPLHNPVRVAEEWALVDNLSDGRVAISFASGWQPNDFALAPDAFADRNNRMFEGIEMVRGLWRGESRVLPGGDGEPVTVTTRPRPVQAELPVWITAGGSPETFRRAGAIGANLLTHLLGQTIEQLAERIAIYRASWSEHGHPGDGGQVALMLHTFVSKDMATVRTEARAPLKNYLKGAVGLFMPAASEQGLDVANLTPEDLDALAEHAFERYFETGGLFGTPESCVPIVEQLRSVGVNELACLIDFGIPDDVVLANLVHLNELRQHFEGEQANPIDHSIEALIVRHEVTHLQCTPSMASMLLNDEASANALGRLSHMLVGGEALTQQLAAGLRQAIPNGRITNMYGPTETTVWSTTHDVSATKEAIPIGTPIANTQVYILDQALNPLPAGAIGDLWIAGDGVTRGYLGRPEMTLDRFLADPFAKPPFDGEPVARMYRTGDLARYRCDGTLDFLGRADHQVKLRGYRIELGEIEAVLRQHPSVADAAVVVREDTPDDKRLVAYLVARPGERLALADIRAYARANLLDYMVPSTVVPMDALPLTPNGKTDRNALPDPSHVPVASLTAPPEATPQTSEVERLIAGIWCDVLKVPSVGLRENFFELGGHSMLIVHVLTRLRTQLGPRLNKDIALSDMFRFPTVESLAEFIGGTPAASGVQNPAKDRAAQRLALRGARGPATAPQRPG